MNKLSQLVSSVADLLWAHRSQGLKSRSGRMTDATAEAVAYPKPHLKLIPLTLLVLMSIALAYGDTDKQPALTIYNQNFVVVREHLPLSLGSGVNPVAFAGVTSQLEPDSVILRDPGGRTLQILEQSYRNDPISQELLLSRFEGKTIDFVVRQEGAKIETVRGKIIRSGYVPSPGYNQGYPSSGMGQPIIEVDGVLRFGLPGQPLFPSLDSDSILKPTLNWQLATDKPGWFDAEISYVSGGMSWQADYNLVVADLPGTKNNLNQVDLVGWITMRNHSGKTFEDARIKLLAGDVNKLQPVPAAKAMYAMESRAQANDAMAPVVREKSFDEFHLYTLERNATLHDQETKQVEFVRATGVRSQRLYIYDGANLGGYYYGYGQAVQDPSYGTQSNPKIWVMQEFKNSDTNHLGIPLPKGRLRFYRRDTDGHLEFVGENTIDHTPKDETIRLYTGNAFDTAGERKRTNFHVDSNRNWMDETFEIRVRNHKKEPVQVRVVEHLYRWNNWKILENSSDYRKTDAQTIEFPVNVAASGEQVVTYTVHYSW